MSGPEMPSALGEILGAVLLFGGAMWVMRRAHPDHIAHPTPSELVSGVADTHPLTADAWRAETTSGAGSLPEARS